MEFLRKIFKAIVVMFALFGLLVFLLIAGIVTAIVHHVDAKRIVAPPDTVVTFSVDDRIVEYAPSDSVIREVFGKQTSILDIVTGLENASEDPKVKGLLVRIDNHSLSYAQIQEIRDAVIAFRKTGKPAIAYADSFGELSRGMASYYLATAFDEIYLQPAGTVDIAGVAAEHPFLKGLLGKLGVEPIGGTRKEYKNAWNIFTEEKFTAPHREAVHRLLGSIFEQTVTDIAEARRIDEKRLRSLIDRAPLFSGEALAERLVDGVKYRDEVITLMEEKAGCAVRTPLSRYRPSILPQTGGTTVALIVAEGEIERGLAERDPFGRRSSVGSYTFAKAVRDAAADPEVKAIVFRINSPGGSVVASETIWHEVVETVRASGKPLIVTMSSVAASGGYYIAMAADHIIAEPATVTGSIGVIVGKMYTPEFWKKLGITFDSEQFGKNARLFSSLTRLDGDQKALLDRTLDDIYDTFVSRVAAARKKKPEEVEEVAKGRIWSGADALEKGLVDELGGYRAAFAAVRSRLGRSPESLRVIKPFPREPSIVDFVLQRDREDEEGGGAVIAPLKKVIRGIAAVGNLLEALETDRGSIRAEAEELDIR